MSDEPKSGLSIRWTRHDLIEPTLCPKDTSMKSANVLTIVQSSPTTWNWQVYLPGAPSSHGTSPSFAAAWSTVSKVIGADVPAATLHMLAARIDGEAGPP